MGLKKHIFRAMITAAAVTIGATVALAANIAVIGGSNGDAFWNLIK